MILLQKICSSTSISQVPFLVDSIIVFVKQLLLSVTLQSICTSANSPCKRSVGFFVPPSYRFQGFRMWVMMIIPVAPAARIHVRSSKRVSNFPSDDNDNNTTRSRDQHRFLSE
ncbi:unnamed protein product [Sphagnum troendelagicum]|uniref:Uncharacterized protein n=1 Tax=Sphagnum troendelagicum TaxID=128251 RepID=A0ABP0TXA5_9BRYO